MSNMTIKNCLIAGLFLCAGVLLPHFASAAQDGSVNKIDRIVAVVDQGVVTEK
jgi:peptidyl-prolyl cis-trans isomerase SurA